jgi:predicted ATPase/DNA-binding SARP family transcriptional activator
VVGARFGILGNLEVTDVGVPVVIAFPQLRRMLCRLLLSPGRTVSKEALYECLWPSGGGDGEGPTDPAATLRLYLSRLRRALPGSVPVRSDGSGYRLDVDRDRVDAARFEVLLAASSVSDGAPGTTIELTREALGLWRGDALAEFRDEPWAMGAAVRLDELRLVAYERLHDAQLAAGLHAEACGDLQRLVDEHPLHERFHAQLMLALYRSGRQAEALRVFQRLRERLGDELGIEPSVALTSLESRLLLQDPALEGGDVAVPTALVARSGRRHNLPADATSFIGRERDLARLMQVTAESRLVTLTGPPGAGKTRLALEVAARLAERYREGAWLVELAGLADLADVRPAVAAVLKIPLRTGEVDDLEAALGSDQVLLVLDNCEHLTGACSALCASLLAACPGVGILATSREPLRTDGETIYRVMPLDLPAEGEEDIQVIAASDAARLFVSRALAQQPTFELDSSNAGLIAGLCRQLDGIPLALEMAAARLRVLSLTQVRDRLDSRLRLLVHGGRPRWPHQQTLESLTAWSYDLLSPADQVLLQKLAVFAPGFDLDAASAFLHRVGHPGDVLDQLTSLVDKSLLTADTDGPVARYRMLETVRQYALDRLAEAEGPAGVTTARDTHAEVYLERAERTQPDRLSADQFAWLERTSLDYDNLRAAVAHLTVSEGGGLRAARLLMALRRFFAWRGRRPELEAAMDALGDRDELAPRDLLTARYRLERLNLMAQRDPITALAQLRELLPVVSALPARGLEAEVYNRLATLSLMTGDAQESLALRQKSLVLARESGDHGALLIALLGVWATVDEVTEAVERALDAGDIFTGYYALNYLGSLIFDEDRLGAKVYFEQALELVKDTGLGGLEYLALNNLGHALVLLGERERARALLGRGYDESRRQRDNRAVHFSLFGLAECATLSGEYPLAATMMGACDKHGERTGFVLVDEIAQEMKALEKRVRDKLGDRSFETARRAGRLMSPDAAVDLGAHRAVQRLPVLRSG